MPYDDGTVRVAENNLCTHVDKAVYEEQTALEHFLMEQHRAASLCRHHDKYAEQVGCQSLPRCVGYRHDCTVDERVNYVMFLVWDIEIIPICLHFHTHSAECIRDDAEVLQ